MWTPKTDQLILFFFFFSFPSYISGVHHFWVRFLRMWPFFNPSIKVVTFRGSFLLLQCQFWSYWYDSSQKQIHRKSGNWTQVCHSQGRHLNAMLTRCFVWITWAQACALLAFIGQGQMNMKFVRPKSLNSIPNSTQIDWKPYEIIGAEIFAFSHPCDLVKCRFQLSS